MKNNNEISFALFFESIRHGNNNNNSVLLMLIFLHLDTFIYLLNESTWNESINGFYLLLAYCSIFNWIEGGAQSYCLPN